MFVLNCLFELIFKSRTKNRTERGCLKQPFCRFKYTMVPSAQNGTAYHNPSSAVVLLYLCLSYVLYVSVSVHCIHRIQHCTSVFCEYKQTHGTDGTREKKTHHRKGIVGKAFSHDVRFSYIVKHVRIIHVHVQCVYGSKNT